MLVETCPRFIISQPLWPSGWHIKCQNARLSKDMIKYINIAWRRFDGSCYLAVHLLLLLPQLKLVNLGPLVRKGDQDLPCDVTLLVLKETIW